jgi:hypothetical protein
MCILLCPCAQAHGQGRPGCRIRRRGGRGRRGHCLFRPSISLRGRSSFIRRQTSRHALKRRFERISGVEPTKRPRHSCRVQTRLRVLLDLHGATPWRQSLSLLFGERLGHPFQISGSFVHGYGNGFDSICGHVESKISTTRSKIATRTPVQGGTRRSLIRPS